MTPTDKESAELRELCEQVIRGCDLSSSDKCLANKKHVERVANELLQRLNAESAQGEDAALGYMAGVFQYWLDFQEVERKREGISIDDDTHLMCPPSWPSRSVLKAWINALRSGANYKSQLEACQNELANLKREGYAPQWQPIETAPKDGTKVLLFLPGPFYDQSENGIVTGMWTGNSDSWWLSSIWASSNAHIDPTYWMPLPAAPTPNKE